MATPPLTNFQDTLAAPFPCCDSASMGGDWARPLYFTDMDYLDFVRSKTQPRKFSGIDIDTNNLHPSLFQYQRDLVKAALMKGRFLIGADCGMGKTRMQLEWARIVSYCTARSVLILAPFGVVEQTIEEASRLGISINKCASKDDVKYGVNITNYDKLHLFDCGVFAGIALDESSILKSFTGKTKQALLTAFCNTPFRLCCTATPAPNDTMEIGNHAEFLGVMRSSEMLQKYFINDAANVGHYRVKGHAQSAFWEWVSTWAALVCKPSDLGYSDEGFILPPLHYHWHEVSTDKAPDGFLFALPAVSMTERMGARRDTVNERCTHMAEIINQSNEQWLIFCGRNDEADLMEELVTGCVQIAGNDKDDARIARTSGFINGSHRCLVSKAGICGFGMNFQHCHNVAFIGLSDSWEQLYQSIRRIWRFGQKHDCHVHIVTATTEGAVVSNIQRKQDSAEKMRERMKAEHDLTRTISQYKVRYNPTIEADLPDLD